MYRFWDKQSSYQALLDKSDTSVKYIHVRFEVQKGSVIELYENISTPNGRLFNNLVLNIVSRFVSVHN